MSSGAGDKFGSDGVASGSNKTRQGLFSNSSCVLVEKWEISDSENILSFTE